MKKRYIYLALLLLTVLPVLFFVNWVKNDGVLYSCFVKTYKDPDKKLLALEVEFIKNGFLKDNSVGSYRNFYIKFWSYQYSVEQRMDMSQTLKSHIGENRITMAACMESSFKKLLLDRGRLYKITHPLIKFQEMAMFGTANAELIKESEEYVKTPEIYLQKRVKPELFGSGATKLGIYHLLDDQLREYNGGDILVEHFVKKYKKEGEAILNQEDKEIPKTLKKESFDKSESNTVIETTISESDNVVPYDIKVKQLRLLKHEAEMKKMRLLERKSK